jgi:hypothetical protein
MTVPRTNKAQIPTKGPTRLFVGVAVLAKVFIADALLGFGLTD